MATDVSDQNVLALDESHFIELLRTNDVFFFHTHYYHSQGYLNKLWLFFGLSGRLFFTMERHNSFARLTHVYSRPRSEVNCITGLRFFFSFSIWSNEEKLWWQRWSKRGVQCSCIELWWQRYSSRHLCNFLKRFKTVSKGSKF